MKKRTVRDLDITGRRVLLRVDLNVSLRAGAVVDDSRIRASLPTLRYLLDAGASVVACSHLGRPARRVQEQWRMQPVAQRLREVLEQPVQEAADCVGTAVETQAAALAAGSVLLLENLRFHPGEEANDPQFAASLAKLADAYVNDAFGVAHRAHASTEAVARLLPAAAGLLLERELEELNRVLDPAAGTRAVISGGAKISDKLALLQHIVEQVDILCVGGAMAHTFLLAQGVPVGSSLVETERVADARRILRSAEQHGCRVLLPVDAVVAHGAEAAPQARPVLLADEAVEEGWSIFDIGPRTIEEFEATLRAADVIVWNGPLGLFENPAYAGGTSAIARLLAGLAARTVICGGETVQAVRETGVADRMAHVSSGGGAALAFLEGRPLPGVAVLPDVVGPPEEPA